MENPLVSVCFVAYVPIVLFKSLKFRSISKNYITIDNTVTPK